MKKIISIALIAGLGAFLALAINSIIVSNKTAASEQETNVQLTSVQPTSYMPGPPVNGPDFRTAAEMSVNAVVHIRTAFKTKSSMYDDFYGQLWKFFEGTPYPGQGRMYIGYGSGVIISDDGYIVTNNHVVQDASEIEVTLNDKRKYLAEIIGNDPSTDLALIKIDEEGLPYLRYGNSDDVKIGEWVLAVGNPFNLTSTVTAGIVSAKARDINILGGHSAIESYLQTDAAVNKGNSGGALVNTKGELIGINAAIASNTGYYEGYSFAIPVNIVRKVVDDFMQFGEIQRAYIGVVIQEMTAELAEENKMDDIRGVYIARLSENGGAEEAGIEVGDIILKVDGLEVNSLSELLEVISQHRPGDEVVIEIVRDGKYMSYDIELKNEMGTLEIISSEEDYHSEYLGATLSKPDTEEKHYLGIDNGVKVKTIDQDGLLSRGGIKKGFIITSINDTKVFSQSDVDRIVKNSNYSMIKIEGVYPNGMRVIYSFDL